jgi:hypothetical protein
MDTCFPHAHEPLPYDTRIASPSSAPPSDIAAAVGAAHDARGRHPRERNLHRF